MSPLSIPKAASRNAQTPRPRRWNGEAASAEKAVRARAMSFAKRWSKPALAEASAAAVPVAGVVGGIGATTDGGDGSELAASGSCSSVLAMFDGTGDAESDDNDGTTPVM
jgi:hypothetical protein